MHRTVKGFENVKWTEPDLDPVSWQVSVLMVFSLRNAFPINNDKPLCVGGGGGVRV